MDRSEKAEFTNMCMVYDNRGNVLIQDRNDKEWGGITFPGGHVEPGESFVDSVIREVKEETGLMISNLQLCGVKQFPTSNGARYVVFLYKTNCFSGDIKSSQEGEIRWVSLEEMSQMKLADSMDLMLQVFLHDEITEQYYCKEGNTWSSTLK